MKIITKTDHNTFLVEMTADECSVIITGDKEDIISNKMYDIISNNLEIIDEPYRDWCSECSNGPKSIDSRTIEMAVNNIIRMLKEENIL